MRDAKISIIMPVYNAGCYLDCAINSILDQSFKEFELILVDDGSTDGSSECCDKYSQLDNRVVVIHQKNGGICNARNKALGIACGEYITFCDHDDEFLPGLLEDTYSLAKKTDADVVKFCKKELFLVNDVPVRERQTALKNCIYTKQDVKRDFFALLNGKILECVWDAFFKNNFIKKHNIQFDEKIKYGGEDIEFLLQVISKANIFATMDSVYYMHYVRSGFSTSAKYHEENLATALILWQRITKTACEMDVSIDGNVTRCIYQMMFTLVNPSIDVLVNSSCRWSFRKKKEYIQMLKKDAPKSMLTASVIDLIKLDKKIALSFFLFKHDLFALLLWVFIIRRNQLQSKASWNIFHQRKNVKENSFKFKKGS